MSASRPSRQITPRSRPYKLKRPRPQPPFRFRDLPLEIRNEIYRLCLVDDVKIAIEEKDQDGFYDVDIYGYDPCEYGETELVHSRESWEGDKPLHMNLNLLFVDKATHQEAATILYGLNKFQFRHEYPWRAFDAFLLRLPRSSLECLRRLDLPFPYIKRYVEGSTVKLRKPLPEVKDSMNIMKWLPKLETLTLRVGDDIMSSDCNHVRWIARMLVKSKIVLEVGTAWIWDEYGGQEDRLVRISAAAVELFCVFGWELAGEFDIIEEQHHFGNEVLWLGWLQQDACRRARLLQGVS